MLKRLMDLCKNLKKVELHCHLDGASRPSTVYEFAKAKNMLPVGVNTLEELQNSIKMDMSKSCDLNSFLEKFGIFVPPFSGDPIALQRIAYEFCEDAARQNIVYVESRYSPHFMSNFSNPSSPKISFDEVVEAILRGFERGQRDFNVKVRSILCTLRPFPEWDAEILGLAEKYRDKGVVGIDIAGQESLDGTPSNPVHIRMFEDAKRLGIHRTVHAGENAPADTVREAIETLHAERVGHAYHSVKDPDVLKLIKDKDIHIEVCPWSSICTGSVESLKQHPAQRFTEENINWGINTDDPIITNKNLNDDHFAVINDMKLSLEQLKICNLNAARASFLPEVEKQELIETLKNSYEKIE